MTYSVKLLKLSSLQRLVHSLQCCTKRGLGCQGSPVKHYTKEQGVI